MIENKRVLIIDDDALVRRMLTRGLRRLGWVVCSADSPATAADLFGLGFDVVLSDWDMPHGGGAQSISLSALHRTPIVIHSGGEPLVPAGIALVRKPAGLKRIDRELMLAIEAPARGTPSPHRASGSTVERTTP